MRPKFLVLAGTLLVAPLAGAQTFPTPDYFRHIVVRPVSPVQIPGSEGLKDFAADGKLKLSLHDAVRLTLLNNTDVRIQKLQYDGTQFAIQRAYQPFDPFASASFSTLRSISPSTSTLAGAAVSSSLSQNTNFAYSQSYQTGTNYAVSFNTNKSSTNSIFATFNPSLATSLNFNVSQQLLRNRGLKPNRQPILIARRNYDRSRADFETSVQDAINRAVSQYWGVVEARENLKVLKRSFDLAEATYQRNKRELELGALPPLDIYRSESQVATRRVQVIQAEYQLKQLEDDFRRTIGADLDPYFRALDLDLTEIPSPAGELFSTDASTALELAFKRRPEMESMRLQLANDESGILLAHNALQPDLNLSASYSSSGRGGNQIDTTTTPPTVIAQGGLHDALSQVGSFDAPSYGFALTLRLPIRTRAAEADYSTAMLSKKRDLYTLRQREQGIALEVRNAVHQLEQAKLSIAASKIARDLAQKNLEAEQRKYDDAQTQLAQAEQALLQSEVSYQRSLASLDRATGTLLDRQQVQISDVKP
ncbi:MAG: TolC family protein [Acidobacteria bacterium]|nr:TolC family protein [Acidobacteriota bacterium]